MQHPGSRAASDSLLLGLDPARLVEAVLSPAFLVTRDRTIVAANRAYHRSARRAWEIEGRPCHWASHGLEEPCDRAGVDCPLETCLRTGQATRAVHLHGGAPGGRWEEVLCLPLSAPGAGVGLCLQQFRILGRGRPEPPGRLVGQSPAMRSLREAIGRLASSAVPILVSGEPGTERELVARALHGAGPCEAGPFVPFFCAGLEDGDFERWLVPERNGRGIGDQGLLEAARGGTLYLDEIAELPPSAQSRLCRSLASGCWDAAGVCLRVPEDFNVVLATTEDPVEATTEGRLRFELLPWLERARIRVPPLRERRADLSALVWSLQPWLLTDPRQEIDAELPQSLEHLLLADNLWELRSRLQYAVLAARGATVRAEHLPPADWRFPGGQDEGAAGGRA